MITSTAAFCGACGTKRAFGDAFCQTCGREFRAHASANDGALPIQTGSVRSAARGPDVRAVTKGRRWRARRTLLVVVSLFGILAVLGSFLLVTRLKPERARTAALGELGQTFASTRV